MDIHPPIEALLMRRKAIILHKAYYLVQFILGGIIEKQAVSDQLYTKNRLISGGILNFLAPSVSSSRIDIPQSLLLSILYGEGIIGHESNSQDDFVPKRTLARRCQNSSAVPLDPIVMLAEHLAICLRRIATTRPGGNVISLHFVEGVDALCVGFVSACAVWTI